MDGTRFDALARRVSTAGTRRGLLRAVGGGAVAALAAATGGGAAGAAPIGTLACSGIGARCGRRDQPGCSTCCTGFASRQNSGQRRCACRPDFGRCRRDDECCGGLCCVVDGDRVCVPGLLTGGRCPDDCGCPLSELLSAS